MHCRHLLKCIATNNLNFYFETYILMEQKEYLKDSVCKVIGVIGGVSWASSATYYRRMNEIMRDRFGSLYSANVLMYSIPFHAFAEQERQAAKGDWTMMTATMIDAAERLKAGGADVIVIASNTLNSLAGVIEEKVGICVLNIIDAVGNEIVKKGLKKIILLGTKHTMEDGFYKNKLEEKFGLEVLLPTLEERDYINDVIFDELCNDIIVEHSREGYKRIIRRLVDEGGEGVILGCTEIPLLITQADLDIPTFDSAEIHSVAAIDFATEGANCIKNLY